MAEHLLDVHLDFDPLELAKEPDATRTIYEVSRRIAEQQADDAHAVLRYDDPRETVVKDGTHPVTGQLVLLVSTRWIVDA